MSKKINVGIIVNTQGLRGEVRVYPLTDYKERFEELNYVYIDLETPQKLNIENVKYKNNLVILKFNSLNNISDVEIFKDLYIYILEEDLRELPKDTYYVFDLIGSKVYYEDDKLLGELTDVIQNAAQDIYVITLDKEINSSQNSIMIPVVKEFIDSIDIKSKTIRVKLIEGMLE